MTKEVKQYHFAAVTLGWLLIVITIAVISIIVSAYANKSDKLTLAAQNMEIACDTDSASAACQSGITNVQTKYNTSKSRVEVLDRNGEYWAQIENMGTN